MNPIHLPEDLFGNLLYDYLNKKGLSKSAETFLNESELTGQIPADFDQHEHPHGFLYGLWTTFCDKYNSRQQIPGFLVSQSQVPNIGAIMETTSQILLEGYSIQLLSSFPSGCPSLSSCDFSSDGKILASGGLGGKPFICYLETSASVTTSDTHSNNIFEVRFQPRSTIFATSSDAKTVKLWNAERLEKPVINFIGHKGVIGSLDFHPSGGTLCLSGIHDEIKVWDLNRRILIKEFKAGGGKVRFQSSGTLLAVADKNVINILDFKNFNVVKCLQGHDKDICSICWDVTGYWIASASEDEVRIWSLMMYGQCLYQYPSNGKKFTSVIFHPRYHNVLVIGSSQGVEMYVIEVGRLLTKHFSGLPTTGLAACMQNEFIASTTTSNHFAVNIWK